MKKYVFESLKFFCAAILCTILSAFATPAFALPSGYTELTYIESTGTQWIDPSVSYTNNDSLRLVMDMQYTDTNLSSAQLSGIFASAYMGIAAGVVGAAGTWSVAGGTTNANADTLRHTFDMSATIGSEQIVTLKIDNNTYTHTRDVGEGNLGILNLASSSSNFYSKAKLYSTKVYKNNTLVRNFVPAKNSSGVVGMYDTVSGQFFTNAGTGTFTGGAPVAQTPTNSGPISSVTVAGLVAQNGTPTPTTPIDIVSNNGVLKASKNLFNPNATQTGWITTNNTISGAGKYIRISAQPGDNYTFSATWDSADGNNLLAISARDSSDNGLQRWVTRGDVTSATLSVTAPVNTAYLVFANYTTTPETIQLERGSTATPYHPYGQIYTDGEVETIADSANHTATVATLLGVGDYRDTQNINTGAITRKVGVKVLDGTEDWAQRVGNIFETGVSPEALSPVGTGSLSNQYTFFSGAWADIPNNGFRIAGTQLRIRNDTTTSTEQLKQYLAEQYANGTPVIIVYPLATPTTESVAGQTMTTAPVNNRTGGVSGMTITTLLSSGASVVTTIATNAIKIATTKYNETKFSPLNTALANAISVVDTVVSNTITQAGRIATLQAQKQTRPNDIADDNEKCPAYKQCLLVEDENGTPHWYEITDPFRDFVAPIIANNVAPASTTNQPGYTQLEYIESTGTQWIDTGVRVELGKVEIKYTMLPTDGDWATIIGKHGDNIIFRRKTATSDYEIYMYSSLPYTWLGGYVENQTRTLQVSRSGNNIIIYSNGQLVFEGQNDKKEGGEDNTSIYLFSSVLSGKSVYPSKSRLYYAKFYTKDGTLVRNFVPVRNNATGKYGLYDTVGKQFYGNANTSGDDFTPGPEVLAQDPAIPGMVWTATWTGGSDITAGTVNGIARCTSVAGTNDYSTTNPTKFSELNSTQQTNWNTAFNSSTLSDYKACWCKVDSVTPTSGNNISPMGATEWTFVRTRSDAAGCAQNCAYYCEHYSVSYAPFVKTMFGE